MWAGVDGLRQGDNTRILHTYIQDHIQCCITSFLGLILSLFSMFFFNSNVYKLQIGNMTKCMRPGFKNRKKKRVGPLSVVSYALTAEGKFVLETERCYPGGTGRKNFKKVTYSESRFLIVDA